MNKYELRLAKGPIEVVEADGWTVGPAGALVFWNRRGGVGNTVPIQWQFRVLATGVWDEVVHIRTDSIDPPPDAM